ncbi:MAG: hypothetical protein H6978_10405 [Gammaproteobacteria bacterium]|nr:hypothetical protein [Gammaproteobacteria bacterium]
MNVAAMTVAPDARLFLLDDESVVFSEATQQLHRLNTAATFLWIHADAGLDRAGLVHELGGLLATDATTAGAHVDETLDHWQAAGLLGSRNGVPLPRAVRVESVDTPTLTREFPDDLATDAVSAILRVRLLDRVAAIEFSDFATLRRTLPLINHLQYGGDAVDDIVLRVVHRERNYYLMLDGKPAGWCGADETIAPMVFATVTNALVSACDYLMIIHCGVVGNGRGALMLPASSGSGKTTLTAALCHAGYRYFTDEVALLQREGCLLRPTPVPLCIKQPSWRLLGRKFPALLDGPVYLRADDKVCRYLAPGGAMQVADDVLTPVEHIVFPKYRPGSSGGLQPISKAEALARLLTECKATGGHLSHADIASIVIWLQRVQCRTLDVDDLNVAIDTLRAAFPLNP